ncbi:hypothetical protein B0H13DRAFT_1914361 [Mycena leptocephala]|nr:hypothetical protein B0H13DRAFT_1914361 [Mycena leptocephala]
MAAARHIIPVAVESRQEARAACNALSGSVVKQNCAAGGAQRCPLAGTCVTRAECQLSRAGMRRSSRDVGQKGDLKFIKHMVSPSTGAWGYICGAPTLTYPSAKYSPAVVPNAEARRGHSLAYPSAKGHLTHISTPQTLEHGPRERTIRQHHTTSTLHPRRQAAASHAPTAPLHPQGTSAKTSTRMYPRTPGHLSIPSHAHIAQPPTSRLHALLHRVRRNHLPSPHRERLRGPSAINTTRADRRPKHHPRRRPHESFVVDLVLGLPRSAHAPNVHASPIHPHAHGIFTYDTTAGIGNVIECTRPTAPQAHPAPLRVAHPSLANGFSSYAPGHTHRFDAPMQRIPTQELRGYTNAHLHAHHPPAPALSDAIRLGSIQRKDGRVPMGTYWAPNPLPSFGLRERGTGGRGQGKRE